MKKLFGTWVDDIKKNKRTTISIEGHNCQFLKLDKEKAEEFDSRIVFISNSITQDIVRKPGSKIKHHKLWKATEYRMMLLYIGPVILKRIIRRVINKPFTKQLQWQINYSGKNNKHILQNSSYLDVIFSKY